MRVALLGYGYWGPNLARNIQASDGFDLAMIVDPSDHRQAAAAAAHPDVPVGPVLPATLDVEALVIATPATTHAECAWEGIRRGCHLFVEKPLALNHSEAVSLVEAARAGGTVVMVDHTFLYTAAYDWICRAQATGALGRFEWYESERAHYGGPWDVGAIWDLGPHDAAILYSIAGRPTEVVATEEEGGEIACVQARYASGVYATFLLNRRSAVKVRRITFGFTDATVVFDDTEPSEKVRVYKRGLHHDPADYRTGDCVVPYIERREALAGALVGFSNRCRNPKFQDDEATETVWILEQAERSAR